jgi:hypothetical protein
MPSVARLIARTPTDRTGARAEPFTPDSLPESARSFWLSGRLVSYRRWGKSMGHPCFKFALILTLNAVARPALAAESASAASTSGKSEVDDVLGVTFDTVSARSVLARARSALDSYACIQSPAWRRGPVRPGSDMGWTRGW